MAWWHASALFNGVISFCYLGITWNILKGLRDTHQMRSNSLALATAGIFFTCAVHHGSHTLHMLLPYVGHEVAEGLAMREAFGASHMTLWDLVGATVAAYYLTLRRGYGRLLTSPQMFDDRVRQEAEVRLHQQAFTDALTGLPNRAAFTDRLKVLGGIQGATPALVFLDLDRFKVVNDTLGHATGDLLLVAVAERLQADLRDGEALFRLGGDEFTVICAARHRAGTETARRLLATLATPFLIEGNELYTGASLGVAQAANAEDVGDLLLWADTAMYHAKDAGRNTVMVFQASMSDKGHRLSMSHDLTKAIDNGEFTLAFQPFVDLETGQIRGAEALIRWVHPTRGVLQPDEFIPIAEETGQIVSIGRWVLLEACRQAASWPTGQLRPYVTVNISPTELKREDFLASVKQALTQTSLPADRLWLEVTERDASPDLALLQSRSTELETLGVRLALDNFGTGWSSLTHLRHLPVKMIKIDRAFVADVAGSTADTLARSVVLLGQALSVCTVAKGIETEDQLQRMKELGCELGQGFLLGRPASPPSFLATLQSGAVTPMSRQDRGKDATQPPYRPATL